MDTKKTLTVKNWSEADQPREKLLANGPKSLSEAELVAILLRTGTESKNVVDLAREVLSLAGNSLTALSRLDHRCLRQVKGMADAKCATLMAALELGWRMQAEKSDARPTIIGSSRDLFMHFMPNLVNLHHEEFWVAYLNKRNRIISSHLLSYGGQDKVPVDLRVLFREALQSHAAAIALAHNHPSGSMEPSRDDKLLTQKIVDAGNLFGISVIDHVIITITDDDQADYFSFHDNGIIL